MKLKGIQFKDIWCGSGALGFVGEGYWWTFLSLKKGVGKNITFVTKTITAHPNKGNVALNKNFQPKKIFPETLKLELFSASATNKFSFSNPGIEKVLESGSLQKLHQPFFISVGSVAHTKEARLREFSFIKQQLAKEKFEAPYGVQINCSCPNFDKGEIVSLGEMIETIELFEEQNIPSMIKLGIDTEINDFVSLDKCDALDAFCFSNTRPVSKGGLSGRPLLADNLVFLKKLRDVGVQKPINAGGGIMKKADVRKYFEAGANSVFIWSVFLLRPWRVKKIIQNN